MLESIASDVGNVIEVTFFSGDWIALLIAFGSVVVAALLMQRGTQIGSMTLLALVLFVIGGFLRRLFTGPVPENTTAEQTGSITANLLESMWAGFMSMSAGMLLAYFIAFMILILVVFGVKSVLSRG